MSTRLNFSTFKQHIHFTTTSKKRNAKLGRKKFGRPPKIWYNCDMLDELKKIGLSENEARVYLALLELGNSAVQQIAQKAAIKRPTTYVQLESLMKRGLVTSFERGPKTLFRAEDPEYLQKVVDRNKKLAEEEAAVLEKILPDLGKLFLTAGERPRVRFFEGVEGLRTLHQEFLKTHKGEVLAIYSRDDLLNIFPSHPQEYPHQRVKKGIRSKVIYTSAGGPVLKKTDAAMLRDSRYIPKEKFPFSCDIALYGDTVAISALHEKPMGIIVESKEITNSLKTVFNLAWEAAEKYQ